MGGYTKFIGAIALALGASACSSANSEPDQVATDVSCADGQIRVQGMLGDLVVDFENTILGYAFENKLTADVPGRVSVSHSRGDLRLEFDTLTANGQRSRARGSFTDVRYDLLVGNCGMGEFVSELSVDSDGEGVHFVLRDLHFAPFCAGSAIEGSLSGCVRSSFNP